MGEREYYSVRSGTHPSGGRLDLRGLRRLFRALYERFYDEGYFQEVIGFDCVDQGFVPGTAGDDTEAFVFMHLKKPDMWPIDENSHAYSEADIFDLMELLHDVVSKGVDGYHHDWDNCGWHYESFDQPAGRAAFRRAVNEILADYGTGYEMSLKGEILETAPTGLGALERAPAPPGDAANVQARVDAAIEKFRRRGASLDERREAVRNLSDVLEFIRPQAKEALKTKDEADLFELANRFGLRHHNKSQQTDYDAAIWLSWMFYYYLATIHAATRLIDRSARGRSA